MGAIPMSIINRLQKVEDGVTWHSYGQPPRTLAHRCRFATFSAYPTTEANIMNAISAKCGHVKRRLNKNWPLTEELLAFALSVVEPAAVNDEFSKFCAGIAGKLRKGTPLGNYEHHIMVNVLLLHVRLSSGGAGAHPSVDRGKDVTGPADSGATKPA